MLNVKLKNVTKTLFAFFYISFLIINHYNTYSTLININIKQYQSTVWNYVAYIDMLIYYTKQELLII